MGPRDEYRAAIAGIEITSEGPFTKLPDGVEQTFVPDIYYGVSVMVAGADTNAERIEGMLMEPVEMRDGMRPARGAVKKELRGKNFIPAAAAFEQLSREERRDLIREAIIVIVSMADDDHVASRVIELVGSQIMKARHDRAAG